MKEKLSGLAHGPINLPIVAGKFYPLRVTRQRTRRFRVITETRTNKDVRIVADATTRYFYVLLNKPKGFITTTSDPRERKTVMHLVEKAGSERLYPVGRLDKNTTGLLLLTNDGELSKKLTHPSHRVEKVYQVETDRPVSMEDLEKMAEGLQLEDGFARPDDVVVLDKTRKVIGIGLHVGRNRIVRRMFEHLGYEVKKLDRVLFAGLTKKDLPRGKWRFLSAREVIWLKHMR